MPKVSVLIPVYNVEPYLRKCLDSVVNQTLKDIEIICVDDGSTDGSPEILEEYAASDPRIRIIHQQNSGLSMARNAGIPEATGEYIHFLDSDDFILLNAYERLYLEASQKDLDILFFDLERVMEDSTDADERETLLKTFATESTSHRYETVRTGPELYLEKRESKEYAVSACMFLLRRSFVEEHNFVFHSGILHEDNAFLFQIILSARRAYHLRASLYRRLMRSHSIMTTSKSFRSAEGYFISYVDMAEFLLTHPQDEIVMKQAVRHLESVYSVARNIYKALSAAEQKRQLTRDHGEVAAFLFQKFLLDVQMDVRTPSARLNQPSNQNSEQAAKMYKQELMDVHASWTYRIGRFITWVPRKARGLIRCYREHGWNYTWRRSLQHFHLPVSLPPDLAAGAQPAAQETNPKTALSGYDFLASLDPLDYPAALKKKYQSYMGSVLNLDAPRTFNEKIQWLKLYDSTPLKTRLADKYAAREWIAEKIGEEYLVALLGVWDSFDDIDFSALPNQFALKCNHGSGWNLIVEDKALLDLTQAREAFNDWMQKNYAFYGLEMHYRDIPPKIIAEEYITNSESIIDYRFYCFNGEPLQIWVDIFSGTPNHKREIYDTNWRKLPIQCTWPSANGLLDERPAHLDQMLLYSRILSKGFPFVRVDFYDVGSQLYAGEMTFTPMGGYGRFNPPELDHYLGQFLTLPEPMYNIVAKAGPKISVIMPVYNTEEYIRSSVGGILSQTLTDFELICVDDGSTDRSLDILRAYERSDPRVKVLTQPNQYAGAARNAGMSAASGKYYLFLDSDDVFSPMLLQTVFDAAENAFADVVLFGANMFDSETGQINPKTSFLNVSKLPKSMPFCGADIPDRLFDLVTPCPWTKLFRASFIREQGLQFQPLRNSNDVYFVLTALAAANRITAVNKELVSYRANRCNSLQNTRKQEPFNFFHAYLSVKKELERRGLYDLYVASFSNLTYSGCLYNLRTAPDRKTAELIYNELRSHMLDELGLTCNNPKFTTALRSSVQTLLYSGYEEFLDEDSQTNLHHSKAFDPNARLL